jgi:hypothetical protein
MEDKRYKLIYNRLSKLTDIEIKRIVGDIDKVCFDTYNYKDGKFCMLAIGMNLHHSVFNPTETKIQTEIAKRFFPVNVLKGVSGKFYRTSRKKDLLQVCNDVLLSHAKNR